VSHVLLATDADWIRDDVVAALSDDETQVSRVRRGDEVVAAIDQLHPTLVILDMQIGNMGGIATCHAIRLEQGAGRLDDVQILMLLDRADDRFLAETANADGYVVKPIDAFRLARAVRRLQAGEVVAEGRPEADAPTALA
jgi:DNA-binding response OmpR family regulator